jgi:exopolysaccharide biosynthesis polyprenyl glycosylphosphotransferase
LSTAARSGIDRQTPRIPREFKRAESRTTRERLRFLKGVFVDLFAVGISSYAAEIVDLWYRGVGLTPEGVRERLGFSLAFSLLVLVCCHGQHLYRNILGEHLVSRCIKAGLGAPILLMALIYTTGTRHLPRLFVVLMCTFTVILVIAWRLTLREVVRRRFLKGTAGRNVLICGTGDVARELALYFERNKDLGYHFRGFVESPGNPPRYNQAKVLGGLDQLRTLVRSNFIADLFVVAPRDRATVAHIAEQLAETDVTVTIIPELYGDLLENAPLSHIGNFPAMLLFEAPINDVALFFKRGVDILGASLALLCAAPLMILIAIAIKLDSKGPVFYAAPRVGQKGRPFNCFKFRTMVHNAEDLLHAIAHLNERKGVLFKVSNDPRITRVGRFLRKYSFDELPQFWNVLRGQMSLVGPRPALRREVDQYIPEHLRRIDVKPGITGLWQVKARRNPSFDDYINLDVQYVKEWSVWLDIRILFETIRVVLAGTGS